MFEAKRKIVEGSKIVSASAIKDILMGVDQRNKMLIKIFEEFTLTAPATPLIQAHFGGSFFYTTTLQQKSFPAEKGF